MSEEYQGCGNCKNFDADEWSEPCEHCTHNMVDGDDKNNFTDNWTPMDTDPSQTAKADAGKPILTLVPPAAIRAIERVRAYGNKKYHDPDNWRTVEAQRHWEAVLRHTLAAWWDFKAKDAESGLMHIDHIMCDLSFLEQMIEDEND